MARRAYLEVICDGCGIILRVETLRVDVTTQATLEPALTIEKQGWERGPIIGATRLHYDDLCPRCAAVLHRQPSETGGTET